jgi:hypothetical protein
MTLPEYTILQNENVKMNYFFQQTCVDVMKQRFW